MSPGSRSCIYPPFCLRESDERAVPGPVALLLCTRSLEERLRDEASTAENSRKEGKEDLNGERKKTCEMRDVWKVKQKA